MESSHRHRHKHSKSRLRVWRHSGLKHISDHGVIKVIKKGPDGTIRFSDKGEAQMGMYVSTHPLCVNNNYTEIFILKQANPSTISLCLVPTSCLVDTSSQFLKDFVAYRTHSGALCHASGMSFNYGPRCQIGDRLGCGIRFYGDDMTSGVTDEAKIRGQSMFFTHNGEELVSIPMPKRDVCAVITMTTDGESVLLTPERCWQSRDHLVREVPTKMNVDKHIITMAGCRPDDWARLSDIKITTQGLFEYTGRGQSTRDVGLAQAKCSLDTRKHYFEIEIVDPGKNCYIAIGLTRRDYPERRHPGWNKGSIAYHADDGKVFVGCGTGQSFGPECHKGDIMGCGIAFPLDCNYSADSRGGIHYVDSPISSGSHSDGSVARLSPLRQNPPRFAPPYHHASRDDDCEDLGDGEDELDYLELDAYASDETSDSEDELWYARHGHFGPDVQVFFTLNGVKIGERPIRIPPGGFYPTVGMLSTGEKVAVNLNPLTG